MPIDIGYAFRFDAPLAVDSGDHRSQKQHPARSRIPCSGGAPSQHA
jgi:hypothetical protein